MDKQNEITYLPREIEVIAQFGQLCTSLSSDLEREANVIAQRCTAPVGAGFSNATEAGRLALSLTLDTPLSRLPDEAALRAAARWNEELEAELTAITAALANNPAAQAGMRRRVIGTLDPLADEIDAVAAVLSDEALEAVRIKLAEVIAAAATAAQAAEVQFAQEPVRGTAQGTWERMYSFARQFAAEAGVRPENVPFEVGDPCPVCQRGLTEAEVQRLQRFDQFIHGAAAAASVATQTALDEAVRTLRDLQISQAANLARSMAEFAALGESQSRISQEVIAYLAAAATRREVMLAGIEARILSPFPQLPTSPAATIRQQTALFHEQAIALEALPVDDQERLVRAAELRDAQRLAENLDLMIQRRADLELHQRLGNCRTSLDTRHISTLASRRRRELVTPDLRSRITQEIAHLALRRRDRSWPQPLRRGAGYAPACREVTCT